MATGMEMMINTIMKSVGLKPEDIKKQVTDIQTLFLKFTENQNEILVRLDRIEKALNIPQVELTQPTQPERLTDGTPTQSAAQASSA